MPAGQSTSVTFGSLKACEVLVVEARALAQVAVVRLEDLGRGRVGDELVDPLAVLLHDPEVELLGAAHVLLDRHALPPRRVVDGGVVVGPPVVGEVLVDRLGRA